MTNAQFYLLLGSIWTLGSDDIIGLIVGGLCMIISVINEFKNG